jgi:hypothetical protein
VVARGHPDLLAELEAMFRDDPRVQVIENRRQDNALLPRDRDTAESTGTLPSSELWSTEVPVAN